MDKPLTTSTLKVAQHCIKQAINLNSLTRPTERNCPCDKQAIGRSLKVEVVQAIEKR